MDTLPEGVQIISIPNVLDARGGLTFAEEQVCIPFSIRRVFWIYDVPEGVMRGGHAHWECSEVVVPVNGSFTMLIDDGFHRSTVRIDSRNKGILIPAGVWCELSEFAPETILVVIASHPYNAAGYVHRYEDFRSKKIGL